MTSKLSNNIFFYRFMRMFHRCYRSSLILETLTIFKSETSDYYWIINRRELLLLLYYGIIHLNSLDRWLPTLCLSYCLVRSKGHVSYVRFWKHTTRKKNRTKQTGKLKNIYWVNANKYWKYYCLYVDDSFC